MSGQVEATLAELGLELPEVAAPLASYVPALQTGRYVYTSGQLPLVGGKLPLTGKVGAEVTAEEATELARVCALNALAAAKSVTGDLARIVRVVKVVGFVASAPDFTGQPGVPHGATQLLAKALGAKGVPARSAVGVSVLPIDSPVEVELLVEITTEA